MSRRLDGAEPASTMGAMALSSGITLAEHYAAGEDVGVRRELVDGVHVVTPVPSFRHAVAAQRLSQILAGACPPGLLVFGSPVNVDREPATNLQPDLAVMKLEDIDSSPTRARPLLVVEILSPSTRRFDLTLKRQLYAEFGIPSYWLVDIDEPSLLVLGLDGRAYHDVARLSGKERGEITRPFDVAISPADLVV